MKNTRRQHMFKITVQRIVQSITSLKDYIENVNYVQTKTSVTGLNLGLRSLAICGTQNFNVRSLNALPKAIGFFFTLDPLNTPNLKIAHIKWAM